MYHKFRKRLNITPSSKLIIGLGDSFTEGQGALSDSTWDKYNHDTKIRTLDLHEDELEEELDNAWVSQICKNHAPQYTPINFGFRGKGNKNAFKNLTTLNSDLGIEKAKDKIVIACLTDMMRYDYINHHEINHNYHNFYTAMWPHKPADNAKGWVKKLWNGYKEGLWSEMFGCVEFLVNAKDLKNWCKLHNAKLLFVSAFSQEFTKDYFSHYLNQTAYFNLIDIIDWENDFYYPDGYNCLTDILALKEGRADWVGNQQWYQSAMENNGTPEGWFTPCAHPSIKGHALIAEKLYFHIKDKGWISSFKQPLI